MGDESQTGDPHPRANEYTGVVCLDCGETPWLVYDQWVNFALRCDCTLFEGYIEEADRFTPWGPHPKDERFDDE